MLHDPQHSLGRMIYVINLIGSRYARQILEPYGLTKEQLFYLGTLVTKGDGITQEELAGRLYVDKSTAARMLMGLEKKGLVKRSPVPGNVRANTVLLTPKARRLWEPILASLWRWQEHLLLGFTEQEVTTLTSMMQRLEANAAAALGKGFNR